MAEQKNQLRQAKNVAEVEGLLLDKKVFTGTMQTGDPFISVNLDIETGEGNVHTVSLFSGEKNKKGEISGLYTGLQTVVNEYQAVAEDDVGRENATKVSVRPSNADFLNGALSRNDYVNDRGLQSFPEITAMSVNRITEKDDYNPRATFSTELVVQSVVEEMDREEEETGRAILKGYIPTYGGRIIPFEFVVAEDGASYVLDNYETNQTVSVYGDIINKQITNTTTIPAAFGEDKKEITTTYVREFLILGGSEPYDEDSPQSYDPKTIRQALAEREVYLEELKVKYEDKKKNANTGGAKPGFDTRSASSGAPKIGDGDLPF